MNTTIGILQTLMLILAPMRIRLREDVRESIESDQPF